MSKPEIIEKTPMNAVALKYELQAIQKRDAELSFRGNRTVEYLNEFVQLNKKQSEELADKLRKLNIARLKEEFIHKVIDTLPLTVDELKLLLQGYTLSLAKDDYDKVMKVVTEYLPEKK